MPTDAPAPIKLSDATEAQLEALSLVSGLPVAAIVATATQNLLVMTAYAMGRESAPAERLYGLLLALPLPVAGEETPPAPASGAHAAILEAAASMEAPFTSRDLARRIGDASSGAVGQVLAQAGWPADSRLHEGSRKWLPRRVA